MPFSLSLNGLTVLVLEDDFYLAEDTRQALEDAGASVLGPFNAPDQAFAQGAGEGPDCAIVDVNLGHGPNFAPAHRLLEMGVPVIFITGYDHSVIPEVLSGSPCLQKPIQAHKVIAAVERVCGR
jgi:DNA-binding response OmpR family regulator